MATGQARRRLSELARGVDLSRCFGTWPAWFLGFPLSILFTSPQQREGENVSDRVQYTERSGATKNGGVNGEERQKLNFEEYSEVATWESSQILT